MSKVIILEETTKNPITLIGKRAGVCWGSDVSDYEKNYKRGLDCIKSDHGRVLEFVNAEMVLDGYSARVIREWYTHIGGSPTRLQASTRYINYDNFEFVIPPSIANNKGARVKYIATMRKISEACKSLEEEYDVKREDAAMLLPLGMSTKIVDKRSLRSLVEMAKQRKCTRAYLEYKQLFKDIENALSDYSEEWAWIVDNLFKKKCDWLGYCPEKNSCGYKERLYEGHKKN